MYLVAYTLILVQKAFDANDKKFEKDSLLERHAA